LESRSTHKGNITADSFGIDWRVKTYDIELEKNRRVKVITYMMGRVWLGYLFACPSYVAQRRHVEEHYGGLPSQSASCNQI